MYDPSIGRWISEDPLGFQIPEAPAEERYTWAGRDHRAEAELERNRQPLYFAPHAGGWVSVDPRTHWGESNLYRYVNNRPTIATDPSGMDVYLENYRGVASLDGTDALHHRITVDTWDEKGKHTGKRSFSFREVSWAWPWEHWDSKWLGFGFSSRELGDLSTGQVYEDKEGGKYSLEKKRTTSKKQDAVMLRLLEALDKKTAGYAIDVGHTCRGFSQGAFEWNLGPK